MLQHQNQKNLTTKINYVFVHSFYKGMLQREDVFRIPQMQNIYDYLRTTLVPEMSKKAVPKLNEAAIRRLAEKGLVTMLFGGLSIKFSIVEKDIVSPDKFLTPEEEALIKKY